MEENSEALFRRSLMANSDIFSTINSFADDNQLVVKRQARRRGPAAKRNKQGLRRRRKRGGRGNAQIQALQNQIRNLQSRINALQNGLGINNGGSDDYYYAR